MPSVSTISTFNHEVDRCIDDIRRCVTSCQEIRTQRHLDRGHHRTTQLDDLENSLQAGAGYIRGEASKYPTLADADPDGNDDAGMSEFMGYIMEIEEVNASLQAIAYPDHHHRHRHHHLSHVLFPGWDYDAHHHAEHPHFYELRVKWESIRDAIPRTFAQMEVRVALKKQLREKEKEEEEKIKKKRDALQKQIDEARKKNEEELEKLQDHNEDRQLEQERIEHKRDLAVERLVETKLEEDPVQKLDELAHVVRNLSRPATPRSSQRGVNVCLHANTRASAVGLGGGSETLVLDDHHHGRSRSHVHPRHYRHTIPVRRCRSYSPSYSSDSSTPSVVREIPTIENHIYNTTGEAEVIDDEEDVIIDGRNVVVHNGHHGGPRHGYGHGHARIQDASRESDHHFVTISRSELAELIEGRRGGR